MQIIQHDAYKARATSEQVKSLVINAKRGEIYALDNGVPVKMVLNENVYTAYVDPLLVTEPKKIVNSLKQIAGGMLQPGVDELVADKPNRYRIVAKGLSRKQAELLREKKFDGLGLQKTTHRVYPEGSLAAQTLGFVNAEEKGQYGVEQYFDDQLKGEDGQLKSVTDVRNIPLTIGDQNTLIPAKDGKNIVLTIDRNVQAKTEQLLARQLKKDGGDNGSVVVMDPQNGNIIAMANYPNYNPEKFTTVKDAAAFTNGVISAPYEPGSVIKTYTIATALDKNIITPDSTYVNTDSITVFDTTISNATKGQTGTISIQHALNWSLNTGMVTVAERLGDGQNITKDARNTMYDYFHNKFGLGAKTGIELSNEVNGEIISPEEEQGNAVRYATMSFGQGMNPTMIQTVAGFSSIINGGNYYQPTVVAGSIQNDSFKKVTTPKPVRKTISPEASEIARKMVHDARAKFYASTDKKGYDIGGKTGTSQTIINGSYNNDQTVGTYLGYGGDETPRYVIMVRVGGKDKTLAGAENAMPVFNDLSNWLIDYMKIAPKG